MSKHPIDDLFARQLRGHNVRPGRATWEELQRRMEVKETRQSSFVWWYASAASITVVLLASWWMWSGNEAGEKTIATNQVVRRITKKTVPEEIKPEQAQQSAELKPADEIIAYKRHVAVSKSTPIKDTRQQILATEKAKPIETPLSTVSPEVLPVPEVRIAKVDTRESERTLVVQISTPEIQADKLVVTTEPSSSSLNETDDEKPRKKRFRIGRVLRQFSKLKAGEPVEWEEVGIQPGILMARASEKVHEGKEKLSDSYDNLRYNTFRKNSNNK